MAATKSTQSRAGGEKRGDASQRAKRAGELSRAQTDGVGKFTGRPFTVGPLIDDSMKQRVMRAGERIWVTVPDQRREWNGCEHCGAMVSMLSDEREIKSMRGEQDRIDPNGPYGRKGEPTYNLQILCGACNKRKGDRFIG